MIKVGAITIGQAPRIDVTVDTAPILGDNIEIIEAGALDNLTIGEIKALEPQENDTILVSRLKEGGFAVLSERLLMPKLQNAVDRLEKQGVALIMMMCTGEFSTVLESNVPLVYPSRILNGVVPAVASRGKIIVVVPDISQKEQNLQRWSDHAKEINVFAANPYGDINDLKSIAEKINNIDADLVLLDCMGFSLKMKEMLSKMIIKPIYLNNIARLLKIILDS